MRCLVRVAIDCVGVDSSGLTLNTNIMKEKLTVEFHKARHKTMEGIWIICTNSYMLENGTEIPKGRMEYSYAQFRQACAPNWRRATEDEIQTKDWFKGNYFNLKNV